MGPKSLSRTIFEQMYHSNLSTSLRTIHRPPLETHTKAALAATADHSLPCSLPPDPVRWPSNLLSQWIFDLVRCVEFGFGDVNRSCLQAAEIKCHTCRAFILSRKNVHCASGPLNHLLPSGDGQCAQDSTRPLDPS